jgi:hypothetical protein
MTAALRDATQSEQENVAALEEEFKVRTGRQAVTNTYITCSPCHEIAESVAE